MSLHLSVGKCSTASNSLFTVPSPSASTGVQKRQLHCSLSLQSQSGHNHVQHCQVQCALSSPSPWASVQPSLLTVTSHSEWISVHIQQCQLHYSLSLHTQRGNFSTASNSLLTVYSPSKEISVHQRQLHCSLSVRPPCGQMFNSVTCTVSSPSVWTSVTFTAHCHFTLQMDKCSIAWPSLSLHPQCGQVFSYVTFTAQCHFTLRVDKCSTASPSLSLHPQWGQMFNSVTFTTHCHFTLVMATTQQTSHAK